MSKSKMARTKMTTKSRIKIFVFKERQRQTRQNNANKRIWRKFKIILILGAVTLFVVSCCLAWKNYKALKN